MTSAAASVRALLVYALVLPMALIMGYLLASPTDLGTWAMVGIVFMVLSAPIVLAKHHAVLFLAWNMNLAVFFLPGRPALWLVMSGLSLFVSLFQRALSKDMRFLKAASVLWPLLFLSLVILITARLTGGLGLKILGSENVGGKRYFMLFAAVAGFLAMIAHGVPEGKANQFVGLFFLGALTDTVSTLLPFLGPNFYFLFLLFPAEAVGIQDVGFNSDIIRLWGSSVAAVGGFLYLLARYGARGSLSLKHPLRPLALLALVAIGSAGGFRTFLILMLLTFIFVFYFEGLFKSKYGFTFAVGLIVLSTFLVPLANKLPLPLQRTLSILPLNISPIARWDAQASSEWRLEIWQMSFPEIPKYFWLGKGLGISSAELDLISEMSRRGRISSQEVAILAGDYHSGPLSVIIPFGIWGVIGFVWFLAASLRALHRNYRYGDASLKTVNALLISYFLARLVVFVFIFGGFYGDLAVFAGIVGLSIALNHGIRQPAVARVAEEAKNPTEPEFSGATAPAFARW